jgi:hypothetical protein
VAGYSALMRALPRFGAHCQQSSQQICCLIRVVLSVRGVTPLCCRNSANSRELVTPVVVNLFLQIAREIECEGGRKRLRGGQMEVIGIRLFLLFCRALTSYIAGQVIL